MNPEMYYSYNNEADEINARTRIAAGYESAYNNFFKSTDVDMLSGDQETVLVSFDSLPPGPNNKRQIAYDHNGIKIKLPYADLDARFKSIMEADLDVRFSRIPPIEAEGMIPELMDLTPKLASFRDQPVILLRYFFVLLPDGEMQRGVQRINVMSPGTNEEIGEIWLGRKWKNGVSGPEEVIMESKGLVLAA
jgi:hypothetical protein